MWHRHALLRSDCFTVSAAGRPWTDVHWLFQLGAFGVYRVAGFVGLALVKAAFVAGTAVLLVRTAERSGGPIARALCAVALLGALYLSRHLMPLRPVIVTLAFLAIFLASLEAATRRGREGQGENDGEGPPAHAARRSALWLLPALQVLWVNCQGLSALGPALVGAYLVEAWLRRDRGGTTVGLAHERRTATLLRALAWTFGLCMLASFVTPYGLPAVLLPGQLLARLVPGHGNIFSTAIAENVPPFVLERTSPEQVGHFKWMLLAMALALVGLRPRLRAAHVVILTAFLGLALLANRNVLLLYTIAPVVLAIGIGRSRWASQRLSQTRLVAPVALVAALGGLLALAGVAQSIEPSPGMPTPFHFPVESVRRLVQRGAVGPLFAPDQHGGYVTFLAPALRPYIDTRLVLHTADEYEDYLSLFDDPRRFDALADRHGFRYVVLTTSYPDRYLALAAHLLERPEWTLIYTDGSELLFERGPPTGGRSPDGSRGSGLDERATIDGVLAELHDRYASHPALEAVARVNLARLLTVTGHPLDVDHVLAQLDTRGAAQLRARARLAAGELPAAESLTRLLLLQDGRDPRSLTLMAEIAFQRQRLEEGRRWLGQALEVAPFDSEARSALARLERLLGNVQTTPNK